MSTTNRPNIVYILADDLGYGDLSCQNPDSRIQTPNHDRLAREGMRFTDAHSNSAVCTPTRYGTLTGRYCWRSWLKWGVLFGYAGPLLEPGRPTLGSFLQSQGYRTACIGKWHLGLGWALKGGGHAVGEPQGGLEDPGVDFTKPLREGPHTAGFDYSCVIPASLDMAPYCYVENGQVPEPPTRITGDSPRPAMWRGGWTSPGFEHETCLLELTRRAESFITDHVAETRRRPDGSDEPFFLYFPMPSPHTPHVPRDPFVGKSEAGNYGDFVVEHDWSVGRILDALDRHGLAENTLVIVTSDNGPHKSPLHLEEQYGHRSTHIYRGQKSDAWDGGHRIPLLARFPGHIGPGEECDHPVCLTDMLSTFGDMLQTPLPESAGEDSVSMWPALTGESEHSKRDNVVHHAMLGDFAIRSERWKLIECRGSGGWTLPEERVEADAPPMQLYDMLNDPGEQHNVYEAHPEIAADLQARLDACRKA